MERTVNRVSPKAAYSALSQSPAAAAVRASTMTASTRRAMPTRRDQCGMPTTCGLESAIAQIRGEKMTVGGD
jgi:hypothetical protein